MPKKSNMLKLFAFSQQHIKILKSNNFTHLFAIHTYVFVLGNVRRSYCIFARPKSDFPSQGNGK